MTGLKFTWGTVPPDGYTHGFASMGAPGPMTRDAADARLLGSALLGHMIGSRRANGLRIGIAPWFWDNLDPEVESACRAATDALAGAGLETRELELEGAEHVIATTVFRLAIEGLPSTKAELVAEVGPQLSPVGRALSKYNLMLPAAALVRADRVRAQLRRSLARAFEDVDVLAWPTVPAPPPPIEEPVVDLPAGRVPADYANVRQGGIANLAGVPGISVPCGLTAGRAPDRPPAARAMGRGRAAPRRGGAARAGDRSPARRRGAADRAGRGRLARSLPQARRPLLERRSTCTGR